MSEAKFTVTITIPPRDSLVRGHIGRARCTCWRNRHHCGRQDATAQEALRAQDVEA